MIKKCLIAIAVVALLATTVQAATYPAIKHEGWPWTKIYDAYPICTFDVVLEVGHYVQIYKCDELKMKLEQVDCAAIGKAGKFPCYGDVDEAFDTHGPACVTIQARANFPAVFGATFSGSGNNIIGANYSLTWPDGNTILGGASWESLKLCMTAWSVALWNSGGPTGTLKVGEITINVKPPNEYGP